MKRTLPAVLTLALGAGVASAGTRLVTSWREPSAGPLRFKKVLVIFMAPHESQRRFAEAYLASLMKRTQGVPAYTLIPTAEAKDEKRLREVVQREGFDGAVTMRYIGAGQEVTYQPGLYAPAYYGFYTYYAFAAPLSYDPGYLKVDRVISLETHVYSVKDDKLVWTGLSETTNPDSAKKLVDDVARKVASEMRKHKLIE
ncbi:MAG TPA: hypothetical protein VII13_01840 [Vicinamibacteria bacterium]|jgi:hypothetical protein